ncbi:hypothetical protein ACFYXM_09120 [Streptomyces sp. NPDC002476]|uniref:hypothetical protein n=1 Tax=Streptomyces sp. NPDC002476 TaxID=3364648 RepID=UPI003696979D
MSAPFTDKPRSRRLLYGGSAALTAAALAGGAWFFLDRGQAAVGCDTLVNDQRLASALGSHHSSEMDCKELGAAVKTATGGGTGPRTKAQADNMKQIVLAVSDNLDNNDRVVAADLRLPLAEALTRYTDDIEKALYGLDSQYDSMADRDDPAWQDETGFHFSVFVNELVDVLRAISEDPAAYAVLRNAQTNWGAAQFASLPTSIKGNTLLLAPTGNASALGTYDAIAVDVLRHKDASSRDRWTDLVYAALREPTPAASAPGSALSERITRSWRNSLAKAPAGQRIDHLRTQASLMFTTWIEAVGMDQAQAESAQEKNRRTGESAYGETIRRLGTS